MSTPKSADRSAVAMSWFQNHPFGLFMHWGLYSLRARNEWTQLLEEVPRSEYEPLAKRFLGRRFDADEWARMAKAAGMSYACLTTKHHEGFCLFDSRLTKYSSAAQGARRDFVAEFTSACRRHGLGVGLYYSLMDWHHPDWLALKFGDRRGHRRFLDYIHGQLKELCTNYGRIDLLFYDIPDPYKRPAEWKAKEMNAMVRSLQPHILINDRNRLPGDFATPEQKIEPAPAGRAWQTNMTLNENWGYSRWDRMWKTPPFLAMLLQRIMQGGGSFLLNVGPLADGSIPAAAKRILAQFGGWMKKNKEAFYGARGGLNVMCPCGGPTFVGNTVYIHAHWWCAPDMGIGGILSPVKRVTYLATGKPVKFVQKGTRLLLFDLPRQPPDPIATVFKIEVQGRLKIRPVENLWPAVPAIYPEHRMGQNMR